MTRSENTNVEMEGTIPSCTLCFRERPKHFLAFPPKVPQLPHDLCSYTEFRLVSGHAVHSTTDEGFLNLLRKQREEPTTSALQHPNLSDSFVNGGHCGVDPFWVIVISVAARRSSLDVTGVECSHAPRLQ